MALEQAISLPLAKSLPAHMLPSSSSTDNSPFSSLPESFSLPTQAFQLAHSGSLDSPALDADSTTSTPPINAQDVDPQIIEALRSKDRIYVLKLGEQMEALINDRRLRIDLTPTTSYQRLLVHRCSAFYKLFPEPDPTSKGIAVVPTPESRIPIRRLCDLVPAEATTQPAFKIMRRSPPSDRRFNKAQSQPDSVAGDDADLSDVEPSESGSLGARSNATGGSSSKKRMTIEEREAAYNEARSRIFMGFEEKEKEKEKDMSASSSSLSLVSGSASTSGGGGSSTGDLDEPASSPATESEYSAPTGPVIRDKKEPRHMTRNGSASSSSRSLRSSAASYNGGPSSSRNSRAPSPSFSYPSIYEPHHGQAHDPSQPPPPHGYHNQYIYPYSPPGQPQYFGGYPYYPSYNPYQSPPLPQHSVSDPTTPSSGEPYMSPHGPYGHPYGWPPPQHPPPQHPVQSPPHMQHPSQLPPPHHSMNPAGAPPVPGLPYQTYMPPPHTYSYPIPGYYPQPGQPVESPPSHVHQNIYDVPRSLNGNTLGNPVHPNSAPPMNRNGIITSPTNNGRGTNRHNSTNGVKNRGGAPPMNQGRGWTYGPGIGQGGHVTSPGPSGPDVVGPRLTNSRRTSNNSASSVNSRSSTCDDMSSTASSSTTSSSSRRTYTSNASSQHPLPPRPDWAVGLKPQPTLHATQSRHHDHSHNNSRTMSPISTPRNLNGNPAHHNNNAMHQSTSHQKSPVPLQSPTEFPPLSSVSVMPEKRMPVVSGAWGNNSTNRSIRTLNAGQPNANALVHHGPTNNSGAVDNSEVRLEDSDGVFDRPPPKSAELFNPKVLRRPVPDKVQHEKDSKERPSKGDDIVATAVLVAHVEGMTLGSPDADGPSLLLSSKELSSATV